MVLLNHIVEILALAQPNPAWEPAFRLQRFYSRQVGWILVHVDHPWHRIAKRAQGLAEEALGSRSVSFGGEQEFDGLARRVHGSIQIPILAFHLYIGLVRAVAFVRGL